MESIDFTAQDCYKNLISDLHSGSSLLPVQTLYDLHQRHVIHFPAYASFLCDDVLIDLANNLMDYAETENLKFVAELVASIINAEIIDSPGCELLLETITKIITVKTLKEGGECDLLRILTVERGILPLGLKKLFLNIVHVLLTFGNDDSKEYNEASYLTAALTTQVKFWNRNRQKFTGTKLVQQLSKKLREEEVFDRLWTVVTDGNAAWNSVFQVSSVIVDRTSFPVFKKCVERRLIEAVDERNMTQAIVALALLRGFCSGASDYGNWNAALLNLFPAQAAFVFYVDCLSHIVPLEPTICLKVHVNKVPPAPQGAHSALADYLALVRARLSELQETTDWGGLFGDDDNQQDVHRVLAHFQANRQVPAAVMEAAIFRKDYYERVFLRRVIQVANGGAGGEGEGRSQAAAAAQLLTSLYQCGKCPPGIYREWAGAKGGI
ncbi:hypothetical protein LSTR_LSTR010320 [Laodelphax striatellus]|uniref:Uncharacterized protein n=1 Tax=Laodelphax striatellus TaxID=195883 RepID=A0A482X0Z5_LAOST|nr:hypothetical protein LSTR_LSTR010320 [Laodelphax striatellus]